MAIRGDSVRPEPVKGGPGAPEVEALFRLPLSDFTTARNSLAAKLKKGGQPAEAERVKAIPKPSVAAWVVNQLFWKHPQPLRELLAAGDRFREAQAKQLAGEAADLRGTLDARRSALNDFSRLAVATLEASAHAVTPDLLRRVTTTLEALSAYGSQGVPQLGRLTDDLRPPGFEALTALVPRAGGEAHEGPSRLLRFADSARRKPAPPATPGGTAPSDEDRARRAAAQAAFERVQQALEEVRALAEQAERELRTAAADAQAAEHAKRDAAAKLEEATAVVAAARQRTRSMAAAAEQATQRVEDGERAFEQARRALDEA